MGGAVFMALYIAPYFPSARTDHLAMAIAYGIGQSAMLGAQSAFLSELFETRYRFTAIAASREINVMLLGGTTPFIATALVAAAGGSPRLVVVFAVACQLLTIRRRPAWRRMRARCLPHVTVSRRRPPPARL
jgi:MHS family shikimate/dehydroshikimate transporter-like MFS transporter